MAGLLLAFYKHVSDKRESLVQETEVESNVVKNLLLQDFQVYYPPTPKEVVKMYSNFTCCFYNETYSEKELEDLALKSMELLDEELAQNKSFDVYMRDLKSEIANFKNQKGKILSYETSASTDVSYFTKDQEECAALYCTYSIRVGTNLGNIRELFILRKDEAGHWRILGWETYEEGE